MLVNGSGQIEQSLERTCHRCFLPSFTLVEGFLRRRLKCEKFTDDRRHTTYDRRRTTDDGRRTPSDGKRSHCLWQGELMSFVLSDG
jgi:hypothetical protein